MTKKQLSPKQRQLIEAYLKQAREFDAKFWREQQAFDERWSQLKTSK